jgi:hypothetical protein
MPKAITLPAALSWGILAAVIVSILFSGPNAVRLLRYATDTGQVSDFVPLAVVKLLAVAFIAVGFVITLRIPRNAVGWSFIGVGAGFGVFSAITDGLVFAELADMAHSSIWDSVVGLPDFLSLFSLVLMLIALQLFPNGRLLNTGRIWLGVAGFTVVSGLLGAVSQGARELISVPFLGDLPNDYRFLQVGDTAQQLLQFAVSVAALLAFLGTAASLVMRYRAGTPELREQVKWVALAAVAVVITIAIDVATPHHPMIDAMDGVVITLVPIAAGIAILKYRLYDVDVLISRTLVYGPLTATLAGTYAAAIVFFRLVFVDVFEFDSDAAVATTTLAVAALFVPVKNRFQRWVDRFFKDDERRKLSALGDEFSKAADMLDVSALVTRFEARVSAMTDAPVRVALTGDRVRTPLADVASTVPMTVDAVRVGAIEVGRPTGRGPLRSTELASIHQAAQSLGRLIHLRRSAS